jgi:hypothetical protein
MYDTPIMFQMYYVVTQYGLNVIYPLILHQNDKRSLNGFAERAALL